MCIELASSVGQRNQMEQASLHVPTGEFVAFVGESGSGKSTAGRTVVLVTHHLRDASHVSQIVVFNDGRIAERGTHGELLAREGVYAALWAQQRDLPGAVQPV